MRTEHGCSKISCLLRWTFNREGRSLQTLHWMFSDVDASSRRGQVHVVSIPTWQAIQQRYGGH